MPSFGLPDNVQRSSRLQQLVDMMNEMQTDIKHHAKRVDEKHTVIQSKVNELLKAEGFYSIDQVIGESTANMTPEERRQFEALIAASKFFNSEFDWTLFVAALLMAPEGVVLTTKMIMSLARFTVRVAAVSGVADFSRAAEGGEDAAAEAARELQEAASQAEATAREAGTAGEAGAEVLEGSRAMARVSKFVELLEAIGFFFPIIVGKVEVASNQREELIKAIQGSQLARLSMAYFKKESVDVAQQLELFSAYLDASVGKEKDLNAAAAFSKNIVKNLDLENSVINWSILEDSLEAQDKSTDYYWAVDDLSTDEVVERVRESDQ